MKDKLVIRKYVALMVGVVAMTFSGLNWQIAIFAWIAPACLLFYTRNSKAKGFILLFILFSIVGYISQTCNNLFNVLIVGIINGVSFGIIFTLTYFLDKVLYIKRKGFYSTLIFPTVFVVIEYLVSSVIGTSGIVAQTQIYFKPLAQLSTVTGLFGISFMVIWFASVINWMVENSFAYNLVRKGGVIYGSVFLVIMIFGIIRGAVKTDSENTVKVATVSGAIDLHGLARDEKSGFADLVNNPEMDVPERIFTKDDIARLQIANTIKAAKEGAKIIIWNEGALILNSGQVDTLLTEVKNIAKSHQTYILIAFFEESNSSAIKPLNNKSILVTPKGSIAWEYSKSHLAPPEVPIINKGNSVIPYFDTEYGRIGNVICYDLDFPVFLRQAGKNAIDIMLVPAYDWKEYASLHSKMARFEALQSGYSLIRSNGAGINMVTDNRGNVIDRMNTFSSKSNIFYADLPLTQVTTLYARIGNLFVDILVLFLLVIVGLRIFKRKI